MEKKIKKLLKDSKITWKRSFLRFMLGEFNRIDDGKPINDIQCVAVIKKLIKSINIVLSNVPNDEESIREIEYLKSFLPQEANEIDMKVAINQALATSEMLFKNPMQMMKPVITILEEDGFNVDKGKLSQILKNKWLTI